MSHVATVIKKKKRPSHAPPHLLPNELDCVHCTREILAHRVLALVRHGMPAVLWDTAGSLVPDLGRPEWRLLSTTCMLFPVRLPCGN